MVLSYPTMLLIVAAPSADGILAIGSNRARGGAVHGKASIIVLCLIVTLPFLLNTIHEHGETHSQSSEDAVFIDRDDYSNYNPEQILPESP
jgi:hypothetical protein